MSRKHYLEVAQIIAAEKAVAPKCEQTLDNLARSLADVFKRDNPNFNRARFYTACELEGW